MVAAGPLVIITMRSDSSTASSTSCVDHHHRALRAGDDLQQLVLQVRARQRVERAEGLVHQQHLRLHRQRAGDADALLHAAGDLVRPLGRGVRHADQLERRLGARSCSCAVVSLLAEHALDRQVHVLEAGQPGQQRVVLEHHRALRAGRGDLAVVAEQHAAGRRVRPAIRLSSVDLPQPEWPISVTNSPCSTVQVDVAQRVEAAPCGVSNTISTFCTSMKLFMAVIRFSASS